MRGSYEYTPYVWPMLTTAVFVSVLAVYCWRRRAVPGALPLAIAALFGTLWAVGAALELAAVDVPTKLFWYKSIAAVCIMPIAIARFCFVLEYAGLGRWLTHRNLALLSIPLLLQLLLVLTNDWHHWLALGFVADGTVRPLPGVGGWILTGFGYLLFVVNLIILVRLFFRSPPHRWPVALMLCAMLSTHTFYALDVLNLDPFAPLDPSVLSMNIGFAMYGLALFRFHIFDPIPAARKTVVEQMREGMLVLDTAQKIVDLNPAAEKLLGLPAAHVRGHPAVEILPACSDLSTRLDEPGAEQLEIDIRTGPAARYYALHLSPLKARRGFPLGTLILLHDVTEQKRAQAQLMEQQRALATLQERDRVARELHDSLGQVLGYVKMQAQAARGLLAHDQHTEADRYLAQLVAVTQDAHADVREYILAARVGIAADTGFLPALQQYVRRFSETYGIATELSAPPGLSEGVFEPMVEAQLLRIIQEALTNVRKHAGARRVRIGLSLFDSHAEAFVQDDGAGFDPALLDTAEGQRFGLRFMRERAAEVGGSVEIHSAPGAGTRVIISVPRRRDEG